MPLRRKRKLPPRQYVGWNLKRRQAQCRVDFESALTPPVTPWSESWYESLSREELYVEAERTQRRLAAGLQPVETYMRPVER